MKWADRQAAYINVFIQSPERRRQPEKKLPNISIVDYNCNMIGNLWFAPLADREQDQGGELEDIRFIVIFGSFAQGTAEEESDIDVAIALKNHRPLYGDYHRYQGLREEISRRLAVDPAKIDLVDLNRANILLRFEITAHGRLVAGDEDDYAQYQAFAYREYLDAAPLFDLEDFLIKKRQQWLAAALP